MFDVLSSAVRREIITTLHDSESVTRDRLTETLAAADDAGDAARRRMRIALHHNHLPRLADAGLVVYDDEVVTGTNRLETVAREIARFEEGERAVTQS